MAVEPTNINPSSTTPAAEVTVGSTGAQAAAAPDYATLQQQYAETQKQLQALAAYVIEQQKPQPEVHQPRQAGPATEEELWARAQQGDRQAFNEYIRRNAAQETNQRLQAQQSDAMVQSQLATLYQRYPELADPNHALTTKAVAFKQALMGMGAPNSRQTDLDAILRAVADSRDVLAGRAQPRQPSAGQATPSHRAAPAPNADEKKLTPAEHKLARQYGVKDANKAMKQFYARNQEGRSAVSPQVAMIVREQGEGGNG